MHITNPLESACRLHPSALHNRRGVILSDPNASRFTLTVGVEELPDLICELVVCYRTCTSRREVAAVLQRLLQLQSEPPAARPALDFVLAQGPKS